MPHLFNKDKLLTNYYKCIQIQHLKKKNGTPYIKACLINKRGVINAYLWDMVEFYAKDIKKDQIYAVKAKEEIYNNEKVLNIRHIKPVIDSRYRRYGYDLDCINITDKKMSKFFYNNLIEIMDSYSNKTIKVIREFYIKNKYKMINSKLLGYKQIALKQLSIIYENYETKVDQELCVILILIDRLNIELLMDEIRRINSQHYNSIKLYRINDKEFIKKYKYIVDLISYNFNNEGFFKN